MSTQVKQGDTLRHSFQDMSLGVFQGWCDQATSVRLTIEDQLIDDLKANAQYNGDMEVSNTTCAFYYSLDASSLKASWFNKPTLVGEVAFFNGQALLSSHRVSIDSATLLQSVTYYNRVPLADIERAIAESKLWNEDYYVAQLSKSEIIHPSKIIDYVIKCIDTGRSPCAYFNSHYYATVNPDVIQSKVNPFFHYLIAGENEGRRPSPYFSPTIYQQYSPDLVSWELSLLAHFELIGREERRIHNEFQKTEQVLDTYFLWRMHHEKLRFSEVAKVMNSFAHFPAISLVVPVHKSPIQHLKRCIESVLEQSYPHWELRLADDNSLDEAVLETLNEYAALDNRIKVIHSPINGHISVASNSALQLATGEWMSLLDCRDELNEHALYYVVKALNEQPDTQFIYSDEDKITDSSKRFDPYFKSDWNLDLLYSQNYASHLAVYKTEIVKRIGGFREGFEGSQDYDLLLRYSREIDHQNIVHIPKVLYHKRVLEGSTSISPEEKIYTTIVGMKVLEDHFSALNIPALIEQGKRANLYKVNWPIEGEPLVSLIIPTYNQHELTKNAIHSILTKSTYHNFEILLVDNRSNDPQALRCFAELAQHPKVTLLQYPYPFNYSAINNFAAKHANGSVIGFINNDIEVISPDWLTEMLSHALREDIGCVGAMLYYSNDTVQHAGVVIGMGGVAGHPHKHTMRGDNGYHNYLKVVQNVSAVTGACLLVKKSIFDELGGLNEVDLKVAYNDVDFCLRVQELGYRNLWTPHAELYHHESASRGPDYTPANRERFLKEVEYMRKTWSTDTYRDPYYSVNLTLESDDMSIRV